MNGEEKKSANTTRKDRILAFLCRICPFCVAARVWPKSRFAALLGKCEKSCPACNAFKRVHGRHIAGRDADPQEDGQRRA